MLITMLVLLFLNIYSASRTRSLMFQAKYDSAQSKLELAASSLGAVDTLSGETAEQVISMLGDMNLTRVIITDGQGLALYDSSAGKNAEGQYVIFEEVLQALRGSDVFYCRYTSGTLQSYGAMPITVHDEPIGCVYIMEYDDEQGQIIANLERNIFVSSLILEIAIICASILFSITGSRRMRKILTSVRKVREGEYNHKIRLRGTDELSKLATEFNKLTDRLQDSETMQQQFISDASHELKTPLASIKLLSDSILQNEMDADTMREFVADIGNESDRLTRMAQKLLTLNRSKQDEALEHEVVDVEQVIAKSFRMLIPMAEEKKVRLTGNFEHGCTVLTAEDDLYQVIFNLVENGIKYNKEGGNVHVRLRRVEEDIEIIVEDTGVGIPSDSIEHVFERFYRVDKARSRQQGGAGLGLSIVKELIARNFGTIDVSSIEGHGTKFSLVLPWFEVSEEADDEN